MLRTAHSAANVTPLYIYWTEKLSYRWTRFIPSHSSFRLNRCPVTKGARFVKRCTLASVIQNKDVFSKISMLSIGARNLVKG